MTLPTSGRRRQRRVPAVAYRPVRDEDLLACAQIWSDAIGDYVSRLNQPWFGGDLQPLRRLLAHFARTDPERFWVATDPGEAERVVAFGSATRRGNVWFLGMLFVLPRFQGAGIGRWLLERILPEGVRRSGAGRRADRVARADGGVGRSADGGASAHRGGGVSATANGRESDSPALGTATDSVQPISNALYSQYGMTPRVPVFNFVGYVERAEAFGALPAGVHLTESTPDTLSADVAALGALDRTLLGYEHPQDHAFQLAEGRRLFVARSERGEVLGYGEIAPSGRFGPLAAVDAVLLPAITGQLLATVRAPGAYASWIPGPSAPLFVALLAAGLRFESFPALLLWDRDFADFSRYVPINLALL